MGRMHDALRKAAEEREQKRRMRDDPPATDAVRSERPDPERSQVPVDQDETVIPGKSTGPGGQGGETEAGWKFPVDTVLTEDVGPAVIPDDVVREADPGPDPRRPDVEKRPGHEARTGHETRVSKPPAVTAEPRREKPPARPPRTAGSFETRVSTSRRKSAAGAWLEQPPVTKPAKDKKRRKGKAARSSIDERVVVYHKVRDERSEQFRVLRSNLWTLKPQPRRIIVSSANADEGKSLVVANLAASFAEEGRPRILVIDANLRFPGLAELFTLRDSPGVSEFLQGSLNNLEELIQPTEIRGVDLLPAGESPQNPGALWVGHALGGLLGAVPSAYDYVIVDTPSIVDFADAAVMAPDADGVLLVVQVGGSAKTQTQQALEILDASKARLLGAFATNAR